MRRAVLTSPIPLTPTPSNGEREKARRAPGHSLIQRQWGWGEGFSVSSIPRSWQ